MADRRNLHCRNSISTFIAISPEQCIRAGSCAFSVASQAALFLRDAPANLYTASGIFNCSSFFPYVADALINPAQKAGPSTRRDTIGCERLFRQPGGTVCAF
jgi:hypothetical protein